MRHFLTGALLVQYEAVIDVFRQCVMEQDSNGELPVQLRGELVEENRFVLDMFGKTRKVSLSYSYQQISFSPDSWQLIATGLVPVKNAIGLICNYQTSRTTRFMGDGFLYDPTNLVCEQLKCWLKNLAYRDLSDGKKVKQEIQSYMRYIKTLEQNRIFPCSQIGVAYERTMNSTLSAVTGCLTKACKEIDVRMNQQSMRDVIANASHYSVNSVEFLIQYLFYILRSNKTPVAISHNEIQSGFSSDLTDARNTRSFKLLVLLVNSPVVKIVNREELDAQEGVDEVFNRLDRFHVKYKSCDPNAIKTPLARLANQLNTKIGGNLIPDRHPIRRWYSNVHSGITGYFQHDAALIQHFLKLHQLTEKMAVFCLLCRELKEMIDYFGARTWAFAGKQILDSFQESYKCLDMELHASLYYIHEKTSNHYQSLLQRNHHNKKWVYSFTAADRVFNSLTSGLEGISEQISALSGIVSKTRQPQADHHARQRLEGLVGSLNQFGLFFNVKPILLPMMQIATPGEHHQPPQHLMLAT